MAKSGGVIMPKYYFKRINKVELISPFKYRFHLVCGHIVERIAPESYEEIKKDIKGFRRARCFECANKPSEHDVNGTETNYRE